MPQYTVTVTSDEKDVLKNLVDESNGTIADEEAAAGVLLSRSIARFSHGWEKQKAHKIKRDKPNIWKNFLKDN